MKGRMSLRAEQPRPEYGWCAPPDAMRAGVPSLPMPQPDHMPPEEAELAELASRALRVLLGSNAVLLHPQLRLAVLGRGGGADSATTSRSKCLLEMAVAWLVEQGLVTRQGYGAFSTLTVPDATLSKAEALAYSDFPDEGQLAVLHAISSGSGGGGTLHHRAPSSSAHRPASCLTRLHRHSSPRQFSSRMAGIEKASGRRGKRSVGEDLSSQLTKKMRMQENSGSDCNGLGSGMAAFGGGSGGTPLSPGCMAMSP